MFYEEELATRAVTYLQAQARRGTTVLVSDPGRQFAPQHSGAALGLTKIDEFDLNDSDSAGNNGFSSTAIWRVEP